jgi:hypothetical protein
LKLLAAAAVAGAAAFAASGASASCLHWSIAGDALSLQQSNVVGVSFHIIQRGDDLGGTAQAMRFENNSVLGVRWINEINSKGDVEGSLKGSKAHFKVAWNDGKLGIYDIDIDEDGRVTGATSDFYNPSHHAQVVGMGKLACADAPPAAPPPNNQPVHRLGRAPSSSPPVTEGDVTRAKASQPSVSASTPVSSNTCASGYVWRNARPNDLVCVPPASRTRAAQENAQSAARWTAGAYGPKTCIAGYVWREAFDGDQVCVTPAARDMARQENSQGPARRAN